MQISEKALPCDGCGFPASPEHLAQRIQRLELSTRFRPVHIGVLFVVLAPPAVLGDDFYAPAQSNEFFEPFLDALDVTGSANEPSASADAVAARTARLVEFQRRGYHLAYLSECPIAGQNEPIASLILRLAPTLIRRIRFNYRPKQLVLIGPEISPILDLLQAARLDSLLTLNQGQCLPGPGTGGREWADLFRGPVASMAPRENLRTGL
jgi:hypothetical protein